MIEINNLTRKKIDEKYLKGLAKKVLKSENKERDLSIALIGEQRMRKINEQYRKIDKPTDVLSFEGQEVLLCPVQIKKNARKYNKSFKDEMARVLIHGILHFLGYDHSKKMREKEQKWQKNNQK